MGKPNVNRDFWLCLHFLITIARNIQIKFQYKQR